MKNLNQPMYSKSRPKIVLFSVNTALCREFADYTAEADHQSTNLYFAQICNNNDNSCTNYTVSRTAMLTMALTAALNNINTDDTVDI